MDAYLSDNEQWERVREWLRENGPWILVGLAVGGLAFGGWRWWQARNDRRALAAGALYERVLGEFGRGNRGAGLALVSELSREYPRSAYVDQANLAAASEFVEGEELSDAASRLREVVRHSRDPGLVTIARQRLARVEIGMGKPAQALATLGPPRDAAFESRYHEIRGDAYYAMGNKAAALDEYQAALLDRDPSLGTNRMLELKIEDLRGTVPARSSAAAGSSK